MSSSFDKRHCCLLQVFFPNLDDLPGKPSPSPQIPPPSSSSSSSSSSVEMKMKTAPFPINITVNQAVGLIMERDRSRLQQVKISLGKVLLMITRLFYTATLQALSLDSGIQQQNHFFPWAQN